MGKYKVTCLEKDEYERWNEFVDKSPQGTIFHKTYWLETLGNNFEVYKCLKGQETVGGVPVNYTQLKSLKIAHPPKFTPYGGPIFRKEMGKYVSKISTRKKANKALIKKLKENFSVVYNWNTSPNTEDLQPFIWEGFSTELKYTYVLPLNDLDIIWENMDRGRRKDIRKGLENEELYVEIGNDFEELYTLVEKAYSRKEKNPIDRGIARNIDEIVRERNRCKTFIVKNKESLPLAGIYIIWDEKRAYQLLSGFDPENSPREANPLAIWKAIEFTNNEISPTEYDFEGSMIPGIEQYFRSFGGKLIPIFQLNWAVSSILLKLLGNDFLRKIIKEIK
ncbi:hypothetical protein AKJ44_01465 [candidate division MSBL1 archaeon SCGC-AAA261F17]|uniref:BioF2-like acetyltransferase domain-containing protein n=1 Tax=candidate division MSBL1 archaeon SCGC-AAA261F17 TaxID=1698274 RepID=A0A133V6K8_9EURY|nr:hypothetical protein AKJ44_01465 [candidate division MSBL1 archaeon SCGC-AAA261F17]